MRKIRSQAALVAGVDIPVLMLGESGTGKEVVARLIHKLSPRAHRTFLKVNCAAVPADLLESELFGYEAGAFTGANHAKPGKFELCNKGTILLDEIGEMPPLCRPNFCMYCRTSNFRGWVAARSSRSMSESLRRRISIFPKPWPPSGCAKIFTTG